MDEAPHIVTRFLLAAFLGLFAIAPLYIGIGILWQAVQSPMETPFTAYSILFFCILIIFFILLLINRTMLWKSGRSDQNLLPSYVMKGCIIVFGLVGAVGFYITVRQAEYWKSVLAISYITAAILSFLKVHKRQ